MVMKSGAPMQRRERAKWGNGVEGYEGMAPLINYGFEAKPAGCSDYDVFMKGDVPVTDIYLTRPLLLGEVPPPLLNPPLLRSGGLNR